MNKKTLTHSQLINLAARYPIQSKTEAQRVLREHGHAIKPNLEAFMAAVRSLGQARFDKAQRKRALLDRYLQQAKITHFGLLSGIRRRIGSCDMVTKTCQFSFATMGANYRIGPDYKGNTVSERRDSARDILVKQCLSRQYNIGTHGDVVPMWTSQGEIGCGLSQQVQFSNYSNRCKYRKREVYTRITVPRDWLSRVYFRCLSNVDGLMTIWAQPVDAAGCEAFAATWVEQSRGSSVKLVKGYIARANSYSHHASTLAKAIAGLKRKTKSMSISLLSNEQLLEIAKRHSSAKVSVSDAKAIGACDSGIRSWIARTNIALRDEATTLGELIRAYAVVPATEARAVIVRALRRCRALSA